MSEQGNLFDDVPELRFCNSLIREAKRVAKNRLPFPVGETIEEYNIELRDEVRLEFCALIRKLADTIEKNTLKRQKDVIDFLYKGIKND